jgi:quercetin dioxygenase-like cupin family protein
MKIKDSSTIATENVSMFGSTGTSIKWLWSKKDDVPNFALRKFSIAPNGEIGIHSHDEEHEIFILSGAGLVYNDSGEKYDIKPNITLYVPPNEPHGYRNTGKSDLEFLCIIPIIEK